MAQLATFVDFARGYSCKADTRALGAPDGAIAIPYAGRRASERGACGDDLSEYQKKHDPLLSAKSELEQLGYSGRPVVRLR